MDGNGGLGLYISIYIYIYILLAGKEYIISNLAGKSTSARPWSSRSTMQDSLSCHPSRTRRHWGLTALVTEGYQLSARAGTEWTSSPYWRTAPYMDFKTALIDAFTCYLSSCLVWCETKIFSQGLFLFSGGSICLEKRVLFNMLFDTVASEAIWHVTVTCCSQQASTSKPNQRFPHSSSSCSNSNADLKNAAETLSCEARLAN